MSRNRRFPFPAAGAVLYGLLAGILLRMAVFTSNHYYPDVGTPYTLGVPVLAAVVVGVAAYLVRRS